MSRGKASRIRCGKTKQHFHTLAEICDDYELNHRPRIERERVWYRRLTPDIAIRLAGLARALGDNGEKRCDHHCLKPQAVLEDACSRLLDCQPAIRATRSFDDLHELINSAVGHVRGIGPMYVYDVALRIGYQEDIAPESVYLHRGTRDGAAAFGMNVKRKTIPRDEFRTPLCSLDAAAIEDVLCIYKDQFPMLRE